MVGDGSGGKHVTLNTDREWTDEERRKIKNGALIRFTSLFSSTPINCLLFSLTQP